MRGEYDAILRWPFPYKVTFSLINQLPDEINPHDLTVFFWPDKSSICFQRPRSNMNEAYGFRRFLPLDKLQQNQSQYVKDNTMFIKVELDFLSIPPGEFDSSY